MFGLVVIEVMTPSGHLSNINEKIMQTSKAKSPHNCWTISNKITKVCLSMSSMNLISLLPQCNVTQRKPNTFSNLFRFLLFSEIKAKFHQLIDDKLSFVQKRPQLNR